jgi:hypothetical protein
VLSIVAAVIVVFSIFGLVKVSVGAKQVPAKELLTGSIQRSPAVRKSSGGRDEYCARQWQKA